jgi:hypothetical protein
MKDCCKIRYSEKAKKKSLKCKRKSDNKIFDLPRKFTRKQCLTKKIKGFTMRSSCAPFKDCKKKQNGGQRNKDTKKQFLFNPKNPKKSFDVYIDKNPKDTIHIKYKTLDDVKNTIKKLERLYKNGKYSHKRIWQVGMIMMVRLRVLKNKKPKQYKLSKKYFDFLGNRTKEENFKERKAMVFNL